MKTIFSVSLLFLSTLTTYFYFQLKKKEYAIQCLESEQSRDRNYVLEGKKSIGEKPLKLNDTIVEIHRIWSTTGNIHRVLRIEVKPDSSLMSVFKQFTLQNPLTKEGKTEILAKQEQVVSLHNFSTFKEQLSKIKLAEAAITSDDIMCCFGGGVILWEAKMGNGETYTFSTFCRKSLVFAKTCEALLGECGVSTPQ